MGAITDFTAYKEFTKSGVNYNLFPRQVINALGIPTTGTTSWMEQFAGTTPTTSVVCTSETGGTMLESPRLNPTTAQKWITLVEAQQTALNPGFLLYDRLVHQAGLVANVITSQTTNLPTAALTRYTDGVGVCIAFTIYTTIGGTASDLVVTYTNQAGVGGRTTKPISISSTSSPRLTFMVPLADGDYGVRSVESIILSASTGTAGNVGISLIKPLYFVSIDDAIRIKSSYALGLSCGRMNEIVGDACICALLKTTSTAHIVAGNMRVAEV